MTDKKAPPAPAPRQQRLDEGHQPVIVQDGHQPALESGRSHFIRQGAGKPDAGHQTQGAGDPPTPPATTGSAAKPPPKKD
jgi:hypothetical protein